MIFRLTVGAVLVLAAINTVQAISLVIRLARHVAKRQPQWGLNLWLPAFTSVSDIQKWIDAWRQVLRPGDPVLAKIRTERAHGDWPSCLPRPAVADVGDGRVGARSPPRSKLSPSSLRFRASILERPPVLLPLVDCASWIIVGLSDRPRRQRCARWLVSAQPAASDLPGLSSEGSGHQERFRKYGGGEGRRYGRRERDTGARASSLPPSR